MPAPQEFGQEFDDAPSPWRPVGVNDCGIDGTQDGLDVGHVGRMLRGNRGRALATGRREQDIQDGPRPTE